MKEYEKWKVFKDSAGAGAPMEFWSNPVRSSARLRSGRFRRSNKIAKFISILFSGFGFDSRSYINSVWVNGSDCACDILGSKSSSKNNRLSDWASTKDFPGEAFAGSTKIAGSMAVKKKSKPTEPIEIRNALFIFDRNRSD